MQPEMPPEIRDLIHDMSGIVTSVQGWAELALIRAREGESAVDDLAVLAEDAATLGDMVIETMYVIRHGVARRSEEVDIASIVSRIVRISERIDSGRLRLVDRTRGGRCRGPAIFVRRALQNVLLNALRHARQTVRIELTEEDDRVRIGVHDDGPGLSSGAMDIFERPTGAEGTRMGLASARWSARVLGGDVRYVGRSALGGAHFEVALPKRASRQATGHRSRGE